LDQEVKENSFSLMDYVQFLSPYVKVNVASDTPGNLPSPGEPECDYGEIQENDVSVVESAAEPNERQTCSELQVGMAADDSFSWGKKRKTSCDIDKSFMEFLNMKKNQVASDDDPRKQFFLSLLLDIKEITDKSNEMI
jgi:hypothetical protein